MADIVAYIEAPRVQFQHTTELHRHAAELSRRKLKPEKGPRRSFRRKETALFGLDVIRRTTSLCLLSHPSDNARLIIADNVKQVGDFERNQKKGGHLIRTRY